MRTMNKVLTLVAAVGVIALVAGCGAKANQLVTSSVALKTSGRVSASSPSTSPSSTPKPPLCYAEQLHATLGVGGTALGAGHVQIVLSNVSPRPCWLGGVLPVSGVTSKGVRTPLVFPGPSDTAFPSPVVPGVLVPGGKGAFWVTTCLRCLPRSAVYDKLVIEVHEGELQMPYPQDLGNGRLDGESAAGPIPPPA